MTERQRRARKLDERPPSLSMRCWLREAWFEVARLLRVFARRERIGNAEADETLAALELARRALARDGSPPWLTGLAGSRRPDLREAVAALTLARDYLAALDITWERRLLAAGLDPSWPGSDDA